MNSTEYTESTMNGTGDNELFHGTISGSVSAGMVIIIFGGGMLLLVIFLFKKKKKSKSDGGMSCTIENVISPSFTINQNVITPSFTINQGRMYTHVI